MFYKTFASTLAITVALTATSFAQDKSATQPAEPKVEDVDAKASQDMYLKLGPIKGESQDKAMAGPALGVESDTVGGDIKGKATKAHKDEIDILAWSMDAGQESGTNPEGAGDGSSTKMMGTGSGAGKANFQDLSLAKGGSGGEDRLTENVSLKGGGGGGGKVDVQDISVTSQSKDPKIGDIKGESQDKASVTGFTPIAGAALGAAGPVKPACVTESGAPDANCDGVPDEATTIYKRGDRIRAEPRIQRR